MDDKKRIDELEKRLEALSGRVDWLSFSAFTALWLWVWVLLREIDKVKQLVPVYAP